MNLEWNWLKKRASIHPDKTAVIDGDTGKTWSYGQLYEESIICAQMLKRKGVLSGDRVAILAPNGVEYLILLFACRELGAIFVPFNWRLTVYELNRLIEDCTPRIMFVHPSFHTKTKELTFTECFSTDKLHRGMNEEEKEAPSFTKQSSPTFNNSDPVPLEKPCMMIYTGGTTGKPKGAVLTYRSVITNSLNTIATWSLSENDITATVMPMFHTGGINALTLPVLHAGGTIVIYSAFDPIQIIRGLVAYKCTNVLMVPTMYRNVIETEEFQKEPFSHMKVFLSGGAPCPVTIYDAFAAKSLPFKEGYGLTEAGPNNFFICPDVAKRKRGSVGKPMLLNDIKLVDDEGKDVSNGKIGELVIYGDHLFDHYWQKNKETREAVKDGGLHTGDLAYQDEDGDYYILGRKKEMLLSGGENVYPLEVENVIAAFPQIQEVAVIGLPDEKWGERVVGAVVMGEIVEKEEVELAIQKHCREKLAPYKIPKEIYFFDHLPKTDVGKVHKKAIIDSIQQRKRIHKID
ncbi:AMP-binding protein [Evansella sp. AB-P1]|uniref:class I adenylate-forming enzyme family protein n=1 Tax=Evansella sp. AB-P1 TaxID=3037653 RepID=UPI00241CD086|nr:AMP-binding protein [Evansella sp. AB-P1]MDG5787434.1 AMP-binding protein [Evansella sp. AB-P1]